MRPRLGGLQSKCDGDLMRLPSETLAFSSGHNVDEGRAKSPFLRPLVYGYAFRMKRAPDIGNVSRPLPGLSSVFHRHVVLGYSF